MTVTYDKDGAYIEITEDGVTYRRAIRLEDGVVSLVDPDGTNQKVDLVYVNASDQLVLVLEDDSEVIVAGTGTGDMLKSTYDTDEDGTVDDAEKLEGSTKAQVQDHTPKAHTLASHSTKAHSELTGVTASQHHTKYTDTEADARVTALAVLLTLFDANTILKANSDDTPIALAVAEQTLIGRITAGVITALSATQVRTLLNIEDGAAADLTGLEIVALLEALGASSRLSHTKLDDIGVNDHHTKYTDAEALAAALPLIIALGS